MWVLLECVAFSLSRRKEIFLKNESHASSSYIVFMVGQSIKANQWKEPFFRLILIGRMSATLGIAVENEANIFISDRSQLGVLSVLHDSTVPGKSKY